MHDRFAMYAARMGPRLLATFETHQPAPHQQIRDYTHIAGDNGIELAVAAASLVAWQPALQQRLPAQRQDQTRPIQLPPGACTISSHCMQPPGY
jgi:hypothetical protein